MSLVASRKERRGLMSIRLSDVPLAVRLAAYDKLIMQEDSLLAKVALGQAAHSPSDRVYYIPARAWEKESRKRAWRAK
jgi:hypothetical protein